MRKLTKSLGNTSTLSFRLVLVLAPVLDLLNLDLLELDLDSSSGTSSGSYSAFGSSIVGLYNAQASMMTSLLIV